MHHNWVINVLADLKVFAQSNGLDRLVEHLDDTMMVAAAEIATTASRHSDGTPEHVEEPGKTRCLSGAGPHS